MWSPVQCEKVLRLQLSSFVRSSDTQEAGEEDHDKEEESIINLDASSAV